MQMISSVIIAVLFIIIFIMFYNKYQETKNYFKCTWTSLEAFNEELGINTSAIQFGDDMVVQMVVDSELVSSTMSYKISVSPKSYMSNEIYGSLNNSEGIWPKNLLFKVSSGILTIYKDKDSIYYVAHV
jgi:hypothetical protein